MENGLQTQNLATDDPVLSIVCAFFNEEQSVPLMLEQFAEVIPTLGVPCELVLVDDGSSDQTLFRLKEGMSKIPTLKVIQLYRNYGQVAATSAGMSIARGNWIVMMDGDLQHDPKDISRLLQETKNGHDLVATYRARREETALRLLITWIANKVNRIATGVPVRDFGSGYRLFSTRLLDMLTDQRGHVHYNTPALYLYARSLVEIPIVQSKRPYGSSKWSMTSFILFNLDFFLHAKKTTQILFTLGFIGGIIGCLLYISSFLGFGEARAISAPITICFTSALSILLAIIWREVLQTQRFALGLPAFLIHCVWKNSENGVPSPDSKPLFRMVKAPEHIVSGSS